MTFPPTTGPLANKPNMYLCHANTSPGGEEAVPGGGVRPKMVLFMGRSFWYGETPSERGTFLRFQVY